MMGDRGLRDVSAVRAIFSISIPVPVQSIYMELVEEELACDYCLFRGRDEAHISYFVWRNQTETWTR